MASVVFLRAVNVGVANRCRPAQLAKELKKFDVVNIGAVGTFVVRKAASDSALRAAIARKLSFKCEIMICPAKAISDLMRKDPFASYPEGPNITRFVSVLHKRPNKVPPLPICLPSASLQTSKVKNQKSEAWLLKVIAIQKQFVLGVYRRQMKAIGYLGKIEKILGVPGTVRSWNTIQKIADVLKANE